MLAAEASWIGERIQGLELGPGSTVFDVGSSSERFGCLIQPHPDEMRVTDGPTLQLLGRLVLLAGARLVRRSSMPRRVQIAAVVAKRPR